MEPLELGKFIVNILQSFGARISPIVECPKGFGIIKKRLGQPIKWRNKPYVYFKWPFIDTFEKVDMRARYLQVNAHSFHSSNMEKSIVPYNIIIDVQVEYRVINPLIIYDEYGFKEGEEAYTSYVNNTVQEIISTIIKTHGVALEYGTLDEALKTEVKNHTKQSLNEAEIKAYDNPFCEMYKNLFKIRPKGIEVKECISISNIIITSFDKNISLRTTV